jgi:hypothetical protein
VDVPAQAIKDEHRYYQLQVPKKKPVFVGSSYDRKLDVQESKYAPTYELHVPRPKHQPKK